MALCNNSKLWILLFVSTTISLISSFLHFPSETFDSSSPPNLLISIRDCNHPIARYPYNNSVKQKTLAILQNPSTPYHNWKQFQFHYQRMLTSLKVYVYPDAVNNSSPFANVFLPHPNQLDPKLGNYFSEHMFKINLLRSRFLTHNPSEAHFFFLPFSVNVLRNDPRVHSEVAIADFVANYTKRIVRDFGFWNSSNGADHFYVCCHSVGRDLASRFLDLHRNVIQVVCSSSYFQKFYVTRKDISLPQVWPRSLRRDLFSFSNRSKLVFFAGRLQNSKIRQRLLGMWENDTNMDIFPGKLPYSYEEGFMRSKYCLHVKGYEVNTARISDAIFYECVPVIISDHYELPFSNVLDWRKFSVIVSYRDIQNLKSILLSISDEQYADFLVNLREVKKHFQWHNHPENYDSFHMVMYQLWLRRGTLRFPLTS